jgi:hypothetical protein
MLASSGKVDMYTLQKLLTHKSPAMTQRYAHLRDEALRRAADVADEIFRANGGEKKTLRENLTKLYEVGYTYLWLMLDRDFDWDYNAFLEAGFPDIFAREQGMLDEESEEKFQFMWEVSKYGKNLKAVNYSEYENGKLNFAIDLNACNSIDDLKNFIAGAIDMFIDLHPEFYKRKQKKIDLYKHIGVGMVKNQKFDIKKIFLNHYDGHNCDPEATRKQVSRTLKRYEEIKKMDFDRFKYP